MISYFQCITIFFFTPGKVLLQTNFFWGLENQDQHNTSLTHGNLQIIFYWIGFGWSSIQF